MKFIVVQTGKRTWVIAELVKAGLYRLRDGVRFDTYDESSRRADDLNKADNSTFATARGGDDAQQPVPGGTCDRCGEPGPVGARCPRRRCLGLVRSRFVAAQGAVSDESCAHGACEEARGTCDRCGGSGSVGARCAALNERLEACLGPVTRNRS